MDKALLLDATYADNEERSIMQLYLYNKKKGEFWVKDEEFRPYLFASCTKDPKERAEYLAGYSFGNDEKFKVNAVCQTKLKVNGEFILKVFFDKVTHLVQVRKELGDIGFGKYEHDIHYAKRYLIDHDLEPGNWVSFEEKNGILNKVEKLDGEFDAPMVAFDIETWAGKKFGIGLEEITMSATVDEASARIVSHNTKKIKGLEMVDNEEQLIKIIEEELNRYPVIVTYNGDNFDLPYVKDRAKRLGASFEINGKGIKSKRKGMDNAVELYGKQHIDAYQVMRFLQRTGSVNIVKLDLENVSEKVFGIKKEKVTPQEGNDAWKNGTKLARFVDYNKKDAQVTLQIAKDFLPLFIEISKLTSQTLQTSTRASTSMMVEDLLLKESFKRGVLAPNKPKENEVRVRINNPIKGAFVKEPLAGLHEKISVLDFASLYPSIIISHNISPETVNCSHKECVQNRSPDGTVFCTKEKGIFPQILGKMLTERLKLKAEYKKKKKEGVDDKILFAKQWALKIVLNSAYGYLGYGRARWYSRECASATTAWARQYIHQTIDKAKDAGFDVLYGDSITKDRFVTIKNSQGLIEVKNIENFYKEIDELAWERGNKKLKHPQGYFALSVNPKTKKSEWKEITAIIKHKTNKQIYRVNQKFGETIVTEDHSLLTETKTGFIETKPNKMKNKKMYAVQKIPNSKELDEIDLFEFVKDYKYTRLHKNKAKFVQWHSNKTHIWFSFYNLRKQIKIKRKLKIKSKEFESLCRLLGAYVAEGSASTVKTSKNKYGASLASSDVKWLEELEKDYHLLFTNAKTCIIPSTRKERTLIYSNKTITYKDNTHKLQMMNETSAQLFSCLCGQKSKGKKLPTFIFNVPSKYKKILLDKAIEGDGSHSVNKKLGYSKKYIKTNFQYTTNSLALISGISLLLRQLNRTYSIQYREEKKAYAIKTSTKNNSKIETKRIMEIYSGEVYDLSVKDNENFVDSCGQILLHNTDSTFLLMNDKNKKDIENFLEKVNNELPGTMELELDGYYMRGIFVTKKEGGAAKKRYALMDEKENLKIVGFEYVRRDWCNLAKETQRKVIELVLKDGEPEKAAEYVRNVIKNLKDGKVEKKNLTIITMMKRKPEDYDSVGPHVSAAKKAIAKGKDVGVGTLLSFIITKRGNTISEKAELEEFVKEGDYDSNYYIKNQILPAVIKIVRELGYTEQDLIEGGKQTGLGAWS
jgi:DNA polymerase, archaea type